MIWSVSTNNIWHHNTLKYFMLKTCVTAETNWLLQIQHMPMLMFTLSNLWCKKWHNNSTEKHNKTVMIITRCIKIEWPNKMLHLHRYFEKIQDELTDIWQSAVLLSGSFLLSALLWPVRFHWLNEANKTAQFYWIKTQFIPITNVKYCL